MNNEREVSVKTFRGTTGEAEYFLHVNAPEGAGFEGQLKAVENRYAASLKSLGLTPDTAVFRRVFLSDVLNQAGLVRQSGLFAGSAGSRAAVSLVQQMPLPSGKLSLLAYHIQGRAPLAKQRLSDNHLLVKRKGLSHLWSTGLAAPGRDGVGSAGEQTRAVFGDLVRTLESRSATLRDHCVRTWIYMKDVDLFYQGMVDARRELFARHGLTKDTHYIASTGIEGACGRQFDLVGMDAYSILGLEPRQVSYLNDLDRLCPAKNYNITFERGTRIAYSDRAHCFISGTACIDKAGEILHPGDVLRQLVRTIENIEALLRSGKASLADMMYLIIYLRDPADFPRIAGYLKDNFPGMPLAVVQGAVCRPGWLVEVEGIAAAKNDAPSLPPF